MDKIAELEAKGDVKGLEAVKEEAEASFEGDVAGLAEQAIARLNAKVEKAETTTPAQVSQVESMGGQLGEVEKRTAEVDAEIEAVKKEAVEKITEVQGEATAEEKPSEEEVKNTPEKTDEERAAERYAARKAVIEIEKTMKAEWAEETETRRDLRNLDGSALDQKFKEEKLNPMLEKLKAEHKWFEYARLGGSSGLGWLKLDPDVLEGLQANSTAEENAELRKEFQEFAEEIRKKYARYTDQNPSLKEQYPTLKDFIEKGSFSVIKDGERLAYKNAVRFAGVSAE